MSANNKRPAIIHGATPGAYGVYLLASRYAVIE
jgi:hypothetical protein